MSREADIAWFAGIFEGEGTFETTKRSTARMTIAMSDQDVIARVNTVFPCSHKIRVRDQNEPRMRVRFPNAKDIYVWRVGQGDYLQQIIEAILPWLGERRRTRALEVLAHIDNRQKPGEPRNSTCKNGHALTGHNLMHRGGKSSYVRCRRCMVEQQRAYRERKRAAAQSASN